MDIEQEIMQLSGVETEQDILLEMVSYCGYELKIPTPCNIWVGPKSILSKHMESPRLKFQNDKSTKLHLDKLVPMSNDKENPSILVQVNLELSASEIKMVQDWVKANYEPLMQLWNEEITYRQFGDIVCK